jgi:hypothetical protein
LYGFSVCLLEEVLLFTEGEEVAPPVHSGLEDEISPVGSPIAAAFGRGIMPAREERMEMGSVG